MSGEDPYEVGMTWNFRQRCSECGTTNYYEQGQRVEPHCGHDLPGLVIEMPVEEQ